MTFVFAAAKSAPEGRKKDASAGIVKTKYFDFDKLALDSGETLRPVRLAYETYGRLNADRSNAILVCHALSGDAHAAGKHAAHSRKTGWYDIAIGPGKTFDTNKYFVICSNVIGGCKGSTGPSSTNPRTGKPYGLSFPLVTMGDMAKAQKKLVEHLGIRKLFCVAGGSMGGMQVLEWLLRFPESVHSAMVLECTAKQYPMAMSFHHVGRESILKDPNWQGGNYYGKAIPKQGLSVARQVSHVTYLSHDTFSRKFGRKRKDAHGNGRKFGVRYEVQSYLDYNGKSFVKRFDANSYLYITQAIDDFDLTAGGTKDLADVFIGVKAKVLLVSVTSDWLYPPEQVEELYAGMAEAGVPVVYRKVDVPYGHDAFLIYNNTLGNAMVDFLKKVEFSRRK